MSLKPRKGKGPKKYKLKPEHKKPVVDAAHTLLDVHRGLDGIEVEIVVDMANQALKKEDWWEARLNLATLIGHHDSPNLDKATRHVMQGLQLLAETEEGRSDTARKIVVDAKKKGIDTPSAKAEEKEQRRKLEEYWAGSISGVAKKKMQTSEKTPGRNMREVFGNDFIGVMISGGAQEIIHWSGGKWEKFAITESFERAKEVYKELKDEGIASKVTHVSGEYLIYTEEKAKPRDDAPAPAQKKEFEAYNLGHRNYALHSTYGTYKEAQLESRKVGGPETRTKIDEWFGSYNLYIYKDTAREIRVGKMEYGEQIKIIRKWVRQACGKKIGVRRSRGTAYGWIGIHGSGAEFGSFTEKEKEGLKKLGLNFGGNYANISPDSRNFWVMEALKDMEGPE